jgi:hypothetical protein
MLLSLATTGARSRKNKVTNESAPEYDEQPGWKNVLEPFNSSSMGSRAPAIFSVRSRYLKE